MLPKKLKPVEIPPVKFRDGTVLGRRIPGSKYVRSICDVCCDLIRVTQASACDYCTDCDPREPTMRTPNVAPTREMADRRAALMANCE